MADAFDYVVVGGGSAGAAVAARLSEDPNVSVCVLEWGPTDVGLMTCCRSATGSDLLEGPIDLAYTTTLQPRGNAHIVHSRAPVLGGCSSHNTMIWFKPFPGDWQDWVDQAAPAGSPTAWSSTTSASPGLTRSWREGSKRDPVRLDRGLWFAPWESTKTPTGTPDRSTMGPGSSTSDTTTRPACARPRA